MVTFERSSRVFVRTSTDKNILLSIDLNRLRQRRRVLSRSAYTNREERNPPFQTTKVERRSDRNGDLKLFDATVNQFFQYARTLSICPDCGEESVVISSAKRDSIDYINLITKKKYLEKARSCDEKQRADWLDI